MSARRQHRRRSRALDGSPGDQGTPRDRARACSTAQATQGGERGTPGPRSTAGRARSIDDPAQRTEQRQRCQHRQARGSPPTKARGHHVGQRGSQRTQSSSIAALSDTSARAGSMPKLQQSGSTGSARHRRRRLLLIAGEGGIRSCAGRNTCGMRRRRIAFACGGCARTGCTGNLAGECMTLRSAECDDYAGTEHSERYNPRPRNSRNSLPYSRRIMTDQFTKKTAGMVGAFHRTGGRTGQTLHRVGRLRPAAGLYDIQGSLAHADMLRAVGHPVRRRSEGDRNAA